MKTQAVNYLLNKQRIELIENVSTEYLSMLAILYGDQIETGIKRISDYKSMTMLDAENELHIRTIMLRGQRLRKKKQLMAEHTAAEQAMLERLKKAS